MRVATFLASQAQARMAAAGSKLYSSTLKRICVSASSFRGLCQLSPFRPITQHRRLASFKPIRLFSTAPAVSQQTFTSVPHRSVVQVKGRDTVKLLQGLVSNNVTKLEHAQVDSVYASFLNPQGRMLADAFIHRLDAQEGHHCLLDVDSRNLSSLLSFIKKFKLRSKVTLKDVSEDWKVVQIWGEGNVPEGIKEDAVISKDVRAPGMGWRAVVRSLTDLSTLLPSATPSDSSAYTIHRILRGVAEGSVDFPEGSSVPLENNVDYMNGVDFRKGCYVGQELTARTHHTGVVRKRTIPLSFYEQGSPAPSSLAIDESFKVKLPPPLTEVRSKPTSAGNDNKPFRGRAAGKFTTGIHNIGLGCLRLEQVSRWQDGTKDDGLEFSFENEEGKTILVRPWIPEWWPEPPTPKHG